MGHIVKSIYLRANSPREAFYILRIERITEGYLVRKISGAKGRVLHRECWFRETRKEAEKLYCSIVKRKTSPNRKRVYSPDRPPHRAVQLKLPL